MYGLTNKELIELRLKCLEPFVMVASKTGIEQSVVIQKAEEAWKYAVEPLEDSKPKTTQAIPGPRL